MVYVPRLERRVPCMVIWSFGFCWVDSFVNSRWWRSTFEFYDSSSADPVLKRQILCGVSPSQQKSKYQHGLCWLSDLVALHSWMTQCSNQSCSSALPQGFHSSVDPICDAQKSVFDGPRSPKQLEGIVPTSQISKALCSLQQRRSRLVTQFFRVLWLPKLPCVLWQSHERLMKN